mmetsp:Transcript_8676/g.14957  ORF Transcript_8676/g.14957 Transcript_8676/m.14957 type:complete len:1045 (+) Transcript_8676:228-3362(+)|eukprot:CAMPEP_0196653200 /NCGR_PEP_ID=MMETSP1086-20130531/2791_1 /TAXON_ID=77921 /ORGANISM="Cyanoptyche  gloeocystis , Strain SAG4.97" /LENGTH=1044 /DNA_ID=CAMNT_0041984271 /DNA_START=227 /DNA_END=3361 /DNA_ORIENTATION=+
MAPNTNSVEITGLPSASSFDEQPEEVKKIASFLSRLSGDDRRAASGEIAALVKQAGLRAALSTGMLEKLKSLVEDKASAPSREGALLLIASLAEVAGPSAEPFLVSLMPSVFERIGDKVTPVRTAADAAATAVFTVLSADATKVVLPIIFDNLALSKNWMIKVAVLRLLRGLSVSAPSQIGKALPDIIPVLGDVFGDSKAQVVQATLDTFRAVLSIVGNKDIEPFIPALITAIQFPKEANECVHKLASTTFVQAVDAPTLAIMVPVLVRGLREGTTPVKRKCAVIIENMSKLVEIPSDATPFLPKLLPLLERASQEVADPECRSVASRAHATLLRVAGGRRDTTPDLEVSEEKIIEAHVQSALKSVVVADAAFAVTQDYICRLVKDAQLDFDLWNSRLVTPFLVGFMEQAVAEAVCRSLLAKVQGGEGSSSKAEEAAVEESGEVLCNCTFSLAYGAKILLNNTTMLLRRGHRYGLCGGNGTGKSTLMRAIANGQVEGFPSADVLKTVYVEHDLDASVADLPVLDFMTADEKMVGLEKAKIEATLLDIGFSKEMLTNPVASLSGGWKMKLALGRAMLMGADILLLDEPTNHLDVKNVAWLENYLQGLSEVTSMIVSHDSSFLDHVCTDIIHLDSRKLRQYKGNLSAFVEKHPEAKSYYDLAATPMKFSFPKPGFLEGIKSKDRAILKMQRVSFKYPNTERMIFENATIQVSLSSRVACVGPNGAGKSTLIKVLTGEVEPTEGLVWKHPNLRVAYVAQHAFHHVEEHLDMTPNQYIQWRYVVGEDREAMTKVTRQVSEEEEKKMAQVIMFQGTKRVVDQILGRRKLKNSYEYEVSWVGLGIEENCWVPREKLEDMGFEKLVNEVDAKEAAKAGLWTRPLTALAIQKHLDDFGLEAEFGTHSRIRGLSGGQKVKLVLAAAMWNNPHILVLDEPTNYLDRDSLGALALAIGGYEGGVVVITHNNEFSNSVCPEKWTVGDGKVVVTGATNMPGEKIEMKREDETTDAYGNTIKIKAPKKELSRKEQKAKERLKKLKAKNGEAVEEEEEW